MADEPSNDRASSDRGWTILFVVSVALLIMVVSFGVGLIAERTVFSQGGLFGRTAVAPADAGTGEANPDQAFPRLAAVKRLLESEYFYRPTSPDAAATFAAELDQDALAGMTVAAATPAASVAEYRQELEYAGIHGMTSGLDDEYTVFLEPAIQAPIAEDLRGEYEGIGVVVNQPEGRYTVVSVFTGSPAEEAGLLPNDVILEADGTPLTGLVTTDALALIRGPAGTSVQLLIERPDEPEPFEVAVERRPIITPAVVYEPVADGTLAWIRIGIFGDKTTDQLDEALSRAEEEAVGGIILDLRGNGGGWVTSAQEVIGRFVSAERGPALYEDTAPGANDELESLPILTGESSNEGVPLVVVINEGTASAAEIVAGALRHYDRAQLVGTPTFGKGSVQRVHDFADGSSARVTTAQWLTPDQAPIPDGGLEPDIEIQAITDEDGEDETDEQLEGAIELLRGGQASARPPDPRQEVRLYA